MSDKKEMLKKSIQLALRLNPTASIKDIANELGCPEWAVVSEIKPCLTPVLLDSRLQSQPMVSFV